MTAAPERRIDIVTARLEGQSCERLSDKHRCVLIHDRSGCETRPPKSFAVLVHRAFDSSAMHFLSGSEPVDSNPARLVAPHAPTFKPSPSASSIAGRYALTPMGRVVYNRSDSSSAGKPAVFASPCASHLSRRSIQRASSQSWIELPCPTNMASRCRPATSRSSVVSRNRE